MTLALATLQDDVDMVWPGTDITWQGDHYHLRYDVYPWGAGRDNWPIYCEMSEALAGIGWRIADPCIEHDCISGDLERIPPPPPETPL